MTFAEGVKAGGSPGRITYSRNELPDFLKSIGFKVGAEIGVYKGEYSEFFCKAGLKMYSVDPWLGYRGAGRTQRVQDVQEDNYRTAVERLSKYGELSVIVRKTSKDALADIADGSLDFIYIDGDHRLPYISFDIKEWSRKVKSGGIISGHDYLDTPPHATNVLCHVKTAVDKYVSENEIKNWWLFGKKCLSWMWFKP